MTRAAEDGTTDTTVVIVGAGFAGVGCARVLARHRVQVLLVERNNYHQFQPLLYQAATAQLAASDVGTPLRTLFHKDETVSIKKDEVVSVDAATRTVTTTDGHSYRGEYLVLAVGSQPNFFRTPGADTHAFPLYSLADAQRLRSRIFELFEAADRDPKLVDAGALTFVIVGAGATGVEIAGALADLVHNVLPDEYRDLAVQATRIYLVEHGHAVLAPFSRDAHEYAIRVLQRDGVQIMLGTSVKEVTSNSVVLSDGSAIATRCAIWAGGVRAAPLAANAGVSRGRGGRITVLSDLTVEGFDRVYALGDVADIPSPDGTAFPQLGSVALQTGQWAAKSILADIAGRPRGSFHYHDKGIMAMIGRGAAVAEVGAKRHELHGAIAFAAWLGVHTWLMSGVRSRVDALVSWGWDYFSASRTPALIDRPDAATIDWGDEDGETPAAPGPAQLKPAAR
ncbi:NAD(P)/FAD-dependent oxidoreductase [Frankia sp. Cppng1_Ct_nod]|uniref:NAD(P)/FAD-dependent oxidoreductase n=1 Tax=Frankia sp. Cppng1_Ct_nod TaxID=2897162 RepID=UPI001040E5F8|nr:NAD(P)/FAD-dependent oxidoreductase [Frankia sp. Cppng1_Ct_nod]